MASSSCVLRWCGAVPRLSIPFQGVRRLARVLPTVSVPCSDAVVCFRALCFFVPCFTVLRVLFCAVLRCAPFGDALPCIVVPFGPLGQAGVREVALSGGLCLSPLSSWGPCP